MPFVVKSKPPVDVLAWVREQSVDRRMLHFVEERERARVAKEHREPRPWTMDPIVQKYRFCNVRREDDKVTRWIANYWRKPMRKEPDLWFAMVVARLFNNPDTLADIGPPLPWNPVKTLKILQRRKRKGQRVFNPAYIVSTNGVRMPKDLYVLDHVLSPLWEDRSLLQPTKSTTLSQYHELLSRYNGMGSFISAQVIADLKYVYPLSKANDWSTFAASGPGSKRGLNRLLGADPKASYKEKEWRQDLILELEWINTETKLDLHAQDFQNCLCEFDKYERVLWNEGRPKQLYRPSN